MELQRAVHELVTKQLTSLLSFGVQKTLKNLCIWREISLTFFFFICLLIYQTVHYFSKTWMSIHADKVGSLPDPLMKFLLVLEILLFKKHAFMLLKDYMPSSPFWILLQFSHICQCSGSESLKPVIFYHWLQKYCGTIFNKRTTFLSFLRLSPLFPLPCHQNKKEKVGIRKEYFLNFL